MKRRRWDSKTKMKIVLEGLSGRPVFVFQACRAAINHYRPKMRYIFELVAALFLVRIMPRLDSFFIYTIILPEKLLTTS